MRQPNLLVSHQTFLEGEGEGGCECTWDQTAEILDSSFLL